MGMKSSKAQQGAVSSIQIRFDGGLNYAQSPTQIAYNEMTRALNVIYNSQTGTPETRPGTTCVTASALASPILKIYYYEKSASQKWLVCASGGNLYWLNGTAWVLIGALNDSTTVPSFLTFNTYLLIADGGTNLKKWDGTTFSALSDGQSATAIEEIGARVVVNSKTSPDLVTFSGVEDETMWNTADPTNPAIGIRAGFGDNMAVNGFSVFGTDLIVSKLGDSDKAIYRINTADPTPANWSVSLLTLNNCCQSPHTITAAFNNVYFVDTNGFKSIQGVTEYGDLQVDMAGAKVNTSFNGDECYDLVYIPSYTALLYMIADRVYCYYRLKDDKGTLKDAFTDLQFGFGRVNSIVHVGQDVYLAGNNGYLYKIDESKDTDETAPGVTVDYPTVIVSKRFSFFGGGILRKTHVEFKALAISTPKTACIKATADGEPICLKTVSVKTAIQEVYSVTYDLYSATTLLGDMASTAWTETTTNRVRGSSIQWQIDATEGRFGIEGLTAEIALVTG